MATFNRIAGAEPSTVTFKAATVSMTRNSSVMHQEIITLGDPESSLGMAAVLGAAPASTTFGLVARLVGDSTSIIHGNSTVLQGTSPWTIAGDSTVFQGGSPWSVNIGTNLQSSAAPSSGSSGLIVRPVIDTILTTASSNAFASTSLVIQSSGAALRSYVTAYSITSTVQAPTKVSFYSSGTMLWPLVLAALSSAVTGANLAVSAPAYLFRTIGAADALTLMDVGSLFRL